MKATASAAAALASPSWVLAQNALVRREIRALSSADVDVLKAGIAAMKALPKANYKSWRYQSGVHGFLSGEDAGVPDAATYWAQCEHHTPQFLSWHRWYLLFCEEMIRQLAGTCSFTLPYWDYLADGFLPDALRVPADATNTLYDGTRAMALNDGTGGLSGIDSNALVQVGFNAFSSGIEFDPHDLVHGMVGGNMGWVETAALDPVFWLHHCNIDRYWECWIRQGGGRVNPGSPWADQQYEFHTVTGRRTVIVGDGVRTADLGYTYDNLPCRETIPAAVLDRLKNLRLIPGTFKPPRPLPDPWPWRPLAALEGIVLDGRPTAVVLSRSELERTGATAAARDQHRKLAITLEDVEVTDAARAGGFFIELWMAPDVERLQKSGLEGAERVGAFSTFSVSVASHTHAAGHAHPMKGADLAIPVPESAQRVLTTGKQDAAVVFVRRGLVDRKGQPISFDEKAELFRIASVRLEVAK